MQTDVDKIFTYLETLATNTVSHFLLPPSTPFYPLAHYGSITRGMEQYSGLALPNNCNRDIWSYSDLF